MANLRICGIKGTMYVFERNLSFFTASAYLISQQGPSSRSRICYHNDVIKWNHFPYYWRFVRGILWSTVELWCFLWHAPEQTVEQTIGTPVIWDTIALIITSLQWAAHYLGAVKYHIANVLYFYFLVGAKSCQKWYSLFNKTASFDCKHPQREIIDVIEKYMFWILWDKCTLLFSTPASIMALKYKANGYLSKLPMHICVNWFFFQNKLSKPMLILDWRSSTNYLNRDLSLLILYDIHAVSVLCFVNNCGVNICPWTFCSRPISQIP